MLTYPNPPLENVPASLSSVDAAYAFAYWSMLTSSTVIQ